MIVSKITFQVTTWILGFLLAGNIFFVKRLVDQQDAQAIKQDKNTEIVWQLRQDVTVLKLTVEYLGILKNRPIIKGE